MGKVIKTRFHFPIYSCAAKLRLRFGVFVVVQYYITFSPHSFLSNMHAQCYNVFKQVEWGGGEYYYNSAFAVQDALLQSDYKNTKIS